MVWWKENAHRKALAQTETIKQRRWAVPNTHPCSPSLASSRHWKTVRGPRSNNVIKSEPRALAIGSQIEADFWKRNRGRNEQNYTRGSVFDSENRPRFGSRLPARAARFCEHFWTVGRVSFFDVCWAPRGVSMGGYLARLIVFYLVIWVWARAVLCCVRFPFAQATAIGQWANCLHALVLPEKKRFSLWISMRQRNPKHS